MPRSIVIRAGFGLLSSITARHAKETCALVFGLALVSDTAEATMLDSAAGLYTASGTVVVGRSATSHSVTCTFSAALRGADSLGLRGLCRAYLIVTRSISADLVVNPDTGTITGTYTGARVGPARLSGKVRGPVLDMVITWPAPVYGDTTARMTIVRLHNDRLRIVVMDRIGADGPLTATTDLSLAKQPR